MIDLLNVHHVEINKLLYWHAACINNFQKINMLRAMRGGEMSLYSLKQKYRLVLWIEAKNTITYGGLQCLN